MEIFLRVLIVAVFIWAVSAYMRAPYDLQCTHSLESKAKKKVYPIGPPGNKLSISATNWVYEVYAIAFNKGCLSDVIDVVNEWCHAQNDETSGLFSGCMAAQIEISNRIEKYNTYPNDFPVNYNKKFDYHNLPVTFIYNDYLECDSLLEKLDKVMEGH